MIERKVLVECPHCIEDDMMPSYTPSVRQFPENDDDAKAIDQANTSDSSIILTCRDCGNEFHQFAGALEFDRAGEVAVRGEQVTIIRGFKSQSAIIQAMAEYISEKMKAESGRTIVSETSGRLRDSISQMNDAIHQPVMEYREPEKPRDGALLLADLKNGRITPEEAMRLFRDSDDTAAMTSGAVERIKAIERGENPYDGIELESLSGDIEEPSSECYVDDSFDELGRRSRKRR